MYISNVNSASIQPKLLYQDILFESECPINASDTSKIIYFIKGIATIEDDGKTTELKKHDILLLNPDESITLSVQRKVEIMVLEIDGIVFISSQDIEEDAPYFIVDDAHAQIRHYFELAFSENEHVDLGTEIILRKLSECIVVHILRNKGLSIRDSSAVLKHREIEEVQNYIRAHYSERITLDDLSNLVSINKYYLIRLFKQKTGLSPIDYLIHVRLSEAEHLLKETDTPISDITDIVGFRSASHFSKSFKESNHMTPSQYRKKYQ